jgi:hypothetical protein
MDANNVLGFITILRGTDKYVRDIYTMGGCYKFVALLQYVFGRGEPYMNADGNHCACYIDGLLYDIDGLITDTTGWHKFQREDYEKAQQWSFSKNYMLQIAECPHCGEPITHPSMDYKICVHDNRML